ncbi:hypothetical protein VTN77DRAFT_6667 [Rasamsonia byssochlamydoides]|uniref:uncharacterized protein n=1 Tax=Rasamsonia byssochlamydoides TaxID=89139 RepID=UPI00374414DD
MKVGRYIVAGLRRHIDSLDLKTFLWVLGILGAFSGKISRILSLHRYLTTSVEINRTDDSYKHLSKWMEEHVDKLYDGRLRVSSSATWDLDYCRPDKTTKFKFQPQTMSRLFWHRGHVFYLYRKDMDGETSQESSSLTVVVLWPSRQPITNLLEEAEREYASSIKRFVPIYSPRPKEERKWSHIPPWIEEPPSPARSLDTVIMETELRENLLQTLDQFFASDTAKWYFEKGIPYRTGLLLWGPPGTGKTSLAGAIAAHYDLCIYRVSLQDDSLFENDLMKLSKRVGSRSILLLEDIDVAGIGNRISLSGLLNIIDGFGASQGRVTIMTTNHRDQLAPELIRKGRVDLEIYMGLASSSQIREMFFWIFAPSSKRDASSELVRLANTFATIIPTNTFAPVDIQTYLVQYKTCPENAVKDAEEWVKQNKPQKTSNSQTLGNEGHQCLPFIDAGTSSRGINSHNTNTCLTGLLSTAMQGHIACDGALSRENLCSQSGYHICCQRWQDS